MAEHWRAGGDVFSVGCHTNPDRRPKQHADAFPGEGLLLGIATSGRYIFEGCEPVSSRTRRPDLTLANHFLVRFGAFWKVTNLRRRAKVVDNWRTGLEGQQEPSIQDQGQTGRWAI